MKKFLAPLLLCFFLPLLFFNLGNYSLVDFDEAWYGEIARNILRLHQPLLLYFNGQPYLDHPPLGFDLMATSFSLFGITELAARLPSALLGFGCLVLVYLLGKKLLNQLAGTSAALMLISSVWFIYRAREADLDAPFLFFYLLVLFVALKMADNPMWLYILGAVLALGLQVKSFIGLTILPAVVVLLFLTRQKFSRKQLAIAIVVFVGFILPWALANYLTSGWNFLYRQLAIGTRFGYHTLFSQNTLTYLHNGIGKWYYPALLSFPVSLFLSRRKPQILAFQITIVVLLFGFLTNAKTEIWHLIPLYPLLFLVLCVTLFSFVTNKLGQVLITVLIFLVATFQVYSFRFNLRLTDRGNSDLARVSLAARNRPEPLYLDGSDFFPSTVFYSQKPVTLAKTVFAPPNNNLLGFVANAKRPALLLTQDWRLRTNDGAPDQYQSLAQSGSWKLVMLK